jgi:hypothetical protein
MSVLAARGLRKRYGGTDVYAAAGYMIALRFARRRFSA